MFEFISINIHVYLSIFSFVLVPDNIGLNLDISNTANTTNAINYKCCMI